MRRRAHSAAGFLYGGALAGALSMMFLPETYPVEGLLIGGFFGLLGGRFPDLDVSVGRHRQTLHSLTALALSTLIVFAFFMWVQRGAFDVKLQYSVLVSAGWLGGFASHLLGDSFSYSGVALLHPFTRRRYGLRITRYDSGAVEALVVILGLIAYFGVIYAYRNC